MKIHSAYPPATRQKHLASRSRWVRFLWALVGMLLVGGEFSPLRAANLDDGFGPLSLVDGAAPVPGGCGRPLAACTCCGHRVDTTMDMWMDPAMDMSGPVLNSNVRLSNGGDLDASPNALTVTNVGASAYSINGASNPILTFVRGQTYTFSVTANGHPFYIKTVQGNGTGNAYTNGVTGNGTQTGTVTFTVPLDAPDTLFYDCAIHAAMTNRIDVVNAVPEPASWIMLGVGAVGVGVVARRRRPR